MPRITRGPFRCLRYRALLGCNRKAALTIEAKHNHFNCLRFAQMMGAIDPLGRLSIMDCQVMWLACDSDFIPLALAFGSSDCTPVQYRSPALMWLSVNIARETDTLPDALDEGMTELMCVPVPDRRLAVSAASLLLSFDHRLAEVIAREASDATLPILRLARKYLPSMLSGLHRMYASDPQTLGYVTRCLARERPTRKEMREATRSAADEHDDITGDPCGTLRLELDTEYVLDNIVSGLGASNVDLREEIANIQAEEETLEQRRRSVIARWKKRR